MKKFLLLMMGLFIFSLGLFAEIPHSYVTENPDKEVTQTEALKKYKEKAELNLSVQKIKSKSIKGVLDEERKTIEFILPSSLVGKQIIVVEKLEDLPNSSTITGRKNLTNIINDKQISNNLTQEIKNNILIVSYKNKPEYLYITDLNENYYKYDSNKLYDTLYSNYYINIEIDDTYDGVSPFSGRPLDKQPQGIKYINDNDWGSPEDWNRFYPSFSSSVTDYSHSENIIVVEGVDPTFYDFYIEKISLKEIPSHDFSEWIYYTGEDLPPDIDGYPIITDQRITINFKVVKRNLQGESSLIIDETYKPEYISFTSCTIDNKQDIELEKPITGVTLSQTLGKGLITLQQNDTLEVNGKQYVVGAGGSLTEQSDTLGKINYSFKVENGKLRLRVNEYGLQINTAQPLNLKVTRDGKEVMNHVMNITVPNIQKIVGESDLSIDDSYNKSQYIAIDSCTLNNPQDIAIATPVAGAKLIQVKGKGIVKFETGDILDINGVQSTVNSSGEILERNINLSGISTYYKAQNGNFQIRIDDYKIGQESPQIINMKLLRAGKEIMTHKMYIYVPELTIDNSKTNVKITDEYKGEFFRVNDILKGVKGIEFLSGKDSIAIVEPFVNFTRRKFRELKLNGTRIDKYSKIIEEKTYNFKNLTVNTKESDKLIISLSDYSKKISEPFTLKIENVYITIRPAHDGASDNNHGTHMDKITWNTEILDIVFYYIPSKVVGQSTLEVKEYYPTPEYIAFNSCTTPAPAPIELENSLRDVKVIQNSGNGLVNLEQGDILELNGKKYTIGVGGTLSEQSDTLGNINFKFKVETGKLRLSLTSWGVLEPDRLLTINASREGHPIMEHKMTIKAPRRVEGISTLTFTEKYPIRDIVRFQGISLTAPNIGGIEPPIPAGVSYKSNDGYGIPFMKEGDILEVQCETMRATQKYIIDSKNSLKHQTIDLPGTVLSLLVEDGKLRLGLNNWLVNKNAVLNFRVIRGVNEISNTSITLEVPKAPFDILKNGILDFGKLIQGSKNKKAETSILLEMHQDISNVKFSLSTTTPELVNSSGATLHARDLQAGVQKQGKKRHLVRIIGRLDVPEKQELGVYRGSVLLNVTIK